MTPLVSVVIVAHNHQEFVAQCIESFLTQALDGLEMELVLVDDASTDRTWDVLMRYASAQSLRRLIRHTANTGAPRSYQDGMEAAGGDYLVPVDADDWALVPDALARAATMLGHYSSLAFVHSAYDVVDARGRHIHTERIARRSGVTRQNVAVRELLLRNRIHHSGTMIRKDLFWAIGGYDTSLKNSVDWDLWLRLATRHDVGYIAKSLFAYRQHPDQLHRTRLGVPEEQMNENLLIIDRAIEIAPELGVLRRRAYASNHLLAVGPYSAAFLRRLALRSLKCAVRLDPFWTVRQRALYSAIFRLVATGVLRRKGYQVLRKLRNQGLPQLRRLRIALAARAARRP